MGITISVQNMNHNETESFFGAVADTLSDIVLDSPTGPMMRGIHKYADTMFNSYQLKFFLEELDSANPQSDAERELFSVLRRASESAIRQQGYLWFSGD
ncbi:hypothetical protein [Nocardia violaceofusca]|uniref:hypothetical protein n=1 Tax=Nocardia violaceofusca TaxID=941182 RepID=UPI000AA28F41|nr:hypothetical protein [Nocardia violaceofusca]